MKRPFPGLLGELISHLQTVVCEKVVTLERDKTCFLFLVLRSFSCTTIRSEVMQFAKENAEMAETIQQQATKQTVGNG